MIRPAMARATSRSVTIISILVTSGTVFMASLPRALLMDSTDSRPALCLPVKVSCRCLPEAEKHHDMTKILLAEDDNDMRRFLVKALQNAGYDVASFDNGLSAYNRLREEPFELLLTDIVMPEMDGIELARRATELDPDMKVMFITGFAAVALNPDSQAPKDAKVLSKPFHLRDLVNEVEKLIKAA